MTNNIILAMSTGFILGAVCAIASIRAMIVFIEKFQKREVSEKEPAAEATKEGIFPTELQKQWENFLNYDGSGKGQVSIEDGEE